MAYIKDLIRDLQGFFEGSSRDLGFFEDFVAVQGPKTVNKHSRLRRLVGLRA